jgi:glycosyltransferase involved in cell wall biosynthesis
MARGARLLQKNGVRAPEQRTGSIQILVTIGMPVYNGDAYIEQAVDSILGQTLGDFELIISDNASTDRTRQICQRYAKTDSRVRYHRNGRNVGAARNYNWTVRHARGSFFKWAAHDDLCDSRYLERCVEPLESDSEVVLCYPRTRVIDEQGNDMGPYPDNMHLMSDGGFRRFRDVLFREEGECNAVFGLIRTGVLRRTGIIGAYPASDVVLLGELAMNGKFFEVDEVLFKRRDHPQTSIRANESESEKAEWFDPAKRNRKPRNHWRWTGEYLKAIGRADLPPGDKLRCYGVLAGWVRVHGRRMIRELKQ